MIVSNLRLKNWKNFQTAEVSLSNRVFLVGPNASGKSNLLDVFRFLRDIVKPGGGLQKAVADRGGVSKIRCLAARKDPEVEIEVHLANGNGTEPDWKYALGIVQEKHGHRRAVLKYEEVWKGGALVDSRPTGDDKTDSDLLTQTHLEQISANKEFREVARFFQSISYLHLVPQLVRHPKEFSGPGVPGDPYGRTFLQKLSKVPEKTRAARLRKIEKALQKTVPHLKDLTYVIDTSEGGVPHLEALYDHWRPKAGRQREADFSDGTLRMIGLFWSLLEGDSMLLLEEPELSLHAEIVQKLPGLFHQLVTKRKRQIVISTHSFDLLASRQIGADEVLLLTPSREGTRVEKASSIDEIRYLLEGGMTMADAVFPRTAPKDLSTEQLEFDLSK